MNSRRQLYPDIWLCQYSHAANWKNYNNKLKLKLNIDVLEPTVSLVGEWHTHTYTNKQSIKLHQI